MKGEVYWGEKVTVQQGVIRKGAERKEQKKGNEGRKERRGKKVEKGGKGWKKGVEKGGKKEWKKGVEKGVVLSGSFFRQGELIEFVRFFFSKNLCQVQENEKPPIQFSDSFQVFGIYF